MITSLHSAANYRQGHEDSPEFDQFQRIEHRRDGSVPGPARTRRGCEPGCAAAAAQRHGARTLRSTARTGAAVASCRDMPVV